MNDHVKSCLIKNASQCGRVADVRLDEFVVRLIEMRGNICPLDLRRVEVVKVVDDSDAPAALGEQSVDEIGTDKSGTTGDENSFGHECGEQGLACMVSPQKTS